MFPILSPLDKSYSVDQVCPDTPDTNKSSSALLNISSLFSPAIPENNYPSLHDSLHLVLSSDESSLLSPPPHPITSLQTVNPPPPTTCFQKVTPPSPTTCLRTVTLHPPPPPNTCLRTATPFPPTCHRTVTPSP